MTEEPGDDQINFSISNNDKNSSELLMHDTEGNPNSSQDSTLSPINTPIRTVSKDFLGTPYFKMVNFPYRHHGSLEVKKLRVFNTSDPLKTYSVELNTWH